MNLVLHHGFLGFANIGEVVYFNGVKDHLTDKFSGLRVLVTQVAPAGDIETRGGQLGQQILQALQPGGTLDPDQAVHIIAHSMGGLDSRFPELVADYFLLPISRTLAPVTLNAQALVLPGTFGRN